MIDMLQPAKGERNAFTDFLSRHGDGIFAIVHAVPVKTDVDREVQRLNGLGVGVLQEVAFSDGADALRFTFFDTEPNGKFVLGIVISPNEVTSPKSAMKISHIAPVVREAASVTAFWQHLGFPGFIMQHATPREDSRYRGKPLLLSFEVGFQRLGQINYEWIVPPATPPNIYADFLKLHGEGIQHIGIPVNKLEEASAIYEKLGYEVWQVGAWGEVGKANSGQYRYIDTDSIGGVSVELIHAY
jgi:catechol 2,3-dioxygenase-like lactoylglutathione lyase family enzyme